jgi:hypothetical protein
VKVVCHWSLTTVLLVIGFYSSTESWGAECLQPDVEAHVRQQFAIYGPQSASREYFGFIYLHQGVIRSAVTSSRACASGGRCVVDNNQAMDLIPQRAKVLGEWHTHPHDGSGSLSRDDVRGAYNNRHINCYLAFYSTPSGTIYAWDPKRVSVPIAMASRTHVGNYRENPSLRRMAFLSSNGST